MQAMFSQNTKSDSKAKTSKTKNTESAIIEVNPHEEPLYEPDASQKASNNQENEIYNTAGVEVKPIFPGGIEKFYKYVDYNIKYPDKELNVKGKVYVTFIIEKDGTLTDIKILRDVGYGTGAEVIRVLKKCPHWNAGTLNGKNVRVLYSVPITIK